MVERAAKAKVVISTHFNSKQIFLDSVLSHYVRVGVEERLFVTLSAQA